MPEALVLGKFYPLHAGHIALIKYARSVSDRVCIALFGSNTESTPVADRARWINSEMQMLGWTEADFHVISGVDATPFDLHSDIVWASHIEIFKSVLRSRPQISSLVTSEEYGERLALELGLKHIMFDRERLKNPTSGTAIRLKLESRWDDLPASVKSDLTVRAVFVGAESTGTSTISARVAERLRARQGVWSKTQLVTEYGREVTEEKLRWQGHVGLSAKWTPQDFADIATEQTRREEAACIVGGPVLICDTDALATTVWESRYLADQAQLNAADWGRGDVYFVTHHEGVPFVQDGTRDGEHLRETMTTSFIDLLIEHSKALVVLTGTIDERVDLAVRTIDEILKRNHSFISPY